MIEQVLIWLWIRINIFSLRKYYPQILIPLAGRLMLILSHGIAWIHRKEYNQTIVYWIQRESNLLLGYHYWHFRKEETLDAPDIPFHWFDVVGYGVNKVVRGKWEIVD